MYKLILSDGTIVFTENNDKVQLQQLYESFVLIEDRHTIIIVTVNAKKRKVCLHAEEVSDCSILFHMKNIDPYDGEFDVDNEIINYLRDNIDFVLNYVYGLESNADSEIKFHEIVGRIIYSINKSTHDLPFELYN